MMASFVLVFSAIALSIVEGYIDPQEAYEKSFGDIDSRVAQDMTFCLQYDLFQNLNSLKIGSGEGLTGYPSKQN